MKRSIFDQAVADKATHFGEACQVRKDWRHVVAMPPKAIVFDELAHEFELLAKKVWRPFHEAQFNRTLDRLGQMIFDQCEAVEEFASKAVTIQRRNYLLTFNHRQSDSSGGFRFD